MDEKDSSDTKEVADILNDIFDGLYDSLGESNRVYSTNLDDFYEDKFNCICSRHDKEDITIRIDISDISDDGDMVHSDP